MHFDMNFSEPADDPQTMAVLCRGVSKEFGRGDGRTLALRGVDLEENLLMVEGAVPGPRDGYVLISKSKAPPRERRGFGGSGTVDPLKASKKASGGKAPAKKK